MMMEEIMRTTINVEDDIFNGPIDLRFLGSIRDSILDVLVPVYYSNEVQSTYWWLRLKRNSLTFTARKLIQCNMCKFGVSTPWEFCPRNDCPDSSYWTP